MGYPVEKSKSVVSLEERDELILQYVSLVKYIAQRIADRMPPNIEVDDLISAGVTGLMDAINKFDTGKNIKFQTYAEFRIRGAIYDELRAMDWIPRSMRQKANRLESVYSKLEQEKGRPATEEEVAEAMEVDVGTVQRLLNEVGGVSLINPEDLEKILPGLKANNRLEIMVSSQEQDPVEIYNAHQLRDVVAECIDMLGDRERMVLSLYYYEELTMKEIGMVMDITESRVSQIHTKAMLRLKGKLKKMLGINDQGT